MSMALRLAKPSRSMASASFWVPFCPPTSPFFMLDDQLYGAYNPIYPTDPATGMFTGPAIAAPGSPLNNPFGLNLAYDGTDLYYNDGQNDGDNTIYKIDPSDG